MDRLVSMLLILVVVAASVACMAAVEAACPQTVLTDEPPGSFTVWVTTSFDLFVALSAVLLASVGLRSRSASRFRRSIIRILGSRPVDGPRTHLRHQVFRL